MCLFRGPKMQAPEPVAPVATPTAATNTDVDSDAVFKKLRKKKGASFLTRSNDRESILTAATDQAAKAGKTTLG